MKEIKERTKVEFDIIEDIVDKEESTNVLNML